MNSNGGGFWDSEDVESPFDDVIKQYKKWRAKRTQDGEPPFGLGKWIGFTILVVLLVWLATGVYFVQPGEIGVVRLLGKEVSQVPPGPHYRFPWPIQQVDRVNVEAIRRAEIGFRTDEQNSQSGTHSRQLAESLMLTGDENIAEIQVLVQYRVLDPSAYLFNVRYPDIALVDAAEVALRGVVGKTTIDEVMTKGRSKVEADVIVFLQRLLDAYGTGLSVIEVKLQVVDPPDEVKDAFHEVVRALEDKERLVREAEGYREDLVPKARGEAERVVKAAEAYKEKRVREAQGESNRFGALLKEYRKAPEVTRQRLYLEFAALTLPGVEKFVVSSNAGKGGLVNLLPLKSLVDLEGGAARQPRKEVAR